MKRYSGCPDTKPIPQIVIPAFHAVPVRQRADGWTPLRQAEFVGQLAQCGSVAQAARAVSMGRETAYRLRRKPGAEGFAAAWDVALLRWRVLGARGRVSERTLRRLVLAMEAGIAARQVQPKVTLAQLRWRIETGLWQVLMSGRRYTGVRRKADNSALFAVLARTGRSQVREYDL